MLLGARWGKVCREGALRYIEKVLLGARCIEKVWLGGRWDKVIEKLLLVTRCIEKV